MLTVHTLFTKSLQIWTHIISCYIGCSDSFFCVPASRFLNSCFLPPSWFVLRRCSDISVLCSPSQLLSYLLRSGTLCHSLPIPNKNNLHSCWLIEINVEIPVWHLSLVTILSSKHHSSLAFLICYFHLVNNYLKPYHLHNLLNLFMLGILLCLTKQIVD